MNNSVVGVAISKSVFHLYCQTGDGKVEKKKLKRGELLAYIANMPVSLIGMEACGASHYWARIYQTRPYGMPNGGVPAMRAKISISACGCSSTVRFIRSH